MQDGGEDGSRPGKRYWQRKWLARSYSGFVVSCSGLSRCQLIGNYLEVTLKVFQI
jgi:hypothetical protein